MGMTSPSGSVVNKWQLWLVADSSIMQHRKLTQPTERVMSYPGIKAQATSVSLSMMKKLTRTPPITTPRTGPGGTTPTTRFSWRGTRGDEGAATTNRSVCAH